MNTNIEKEYKILLSEEQFHAVEAQYENLEYHKQVNTYYDTLEHTIEKIHGAMRIRELDNSYIFTMKLILDGDLYEFECPVDANSPTVFERNDIQELMHAHHIQGPFYETASLTTWRAMVCSEDAELCFDKSSYNGHQDFEIEYEYKREHDGLQIFQNILKPANIKYEKNCRSKIRRALDTNHD